MATLSQAQLIKDLDDVLPEFSIHWAGEIEGEEFPSQSLHAVYMALVPFLASTIPTSSQWQSLADLFSREVAAGGDRQNAVDTCVLEHLHQIKLNKIIRPLLSPSAKALVRV